jgi:hypothetical protein
VFLSPAARPFALVNFSARRPLRPMRRRGWPPSRDRPLQGVG